VECDTSGTNGPLTTAVQNGAMTARTTHRRGPGLDEPQALVVTAVHALEQADVTRVLASDDDRAWAGRAAAEALGDDASDAAYVARRAELLHERVASRHRGWREAVQALAWRTWVAPAVLAAAFVTGVVVDEIGAGGRINLLAPPLVGLLAWNLLVYVWLVERWSAGWRRAAPRPPGPLRTLVARLAGLRLPRRQRVGGTGAAVHAFATEWIARAAPLYRARAARILHVAAAAFALGVVAGLYLRGLAFEYRASWSSTFLDASQVRALLAAVLAPGAALTGLAVPDVAHLASIRSGAVPGSENAALWLHLFAATVTLLVVVPRLLLGAVELTIEQRRAARIDVGLDAPDMRRLLRSYRAGPLRTVVVPYSFTLASSAAGALRAMLQRAVGTGTVDLLPTVSYTADDAAPVPVPADATLVVALFNAAATPERETHAAFAAALAARPPHAAIALVDESSLRSRFLGDDKRIAQRRAAWVDALAPHAMTPAFVDLSIDTPAVDEALLRAVDQAA